MNKRDTILIVDDVEMNRAILCNIFEKDYTILEAENGEQALRLIEQFHGRITAVLLDLVMPVMDGYQVMEKIRKLNFLSEFPVIIITAEDSTESEVWAFDLGASDIIMKPFEPHVVRRRVQNIVELNLRKLYQEERIAEQAERLRESNVVMIDALSSIIEYRSVETGQHIKRIRLFTKILLEDVSRSCPEYGLDEHKIEMISGASSLHDIGKIAIPDSILVKPGRLTKEEFEIMKTHSTKGCEILESLDRMSDREYLQYAYSICRYHHERWDGKGYPDGLKGDSIPISAQVVGLADCYDALTSDRVYKKALPPEQAFHMILNGECGIFSQKLLECFKNVGPEFERLARRYADGSQLKAEQLEPVYPELFWPENDRLDTLQLSQMKYFTLLRYLNSTVMEIDLNTGFYHVVYLSSDIFELLKSGKSFEESLRNFAEASVHPEERQMVLELLNGYLDRFFQEGLMKEEREYRILDRVSGEYRPCRVTFLRVDTGSPRNRKLLLIWEELERERP